MTNGACSTQKLRLATFMCLFIHAGQGVSDDGFQFAGGNILELQFTIPKQRDAESTISKAELWLFPNMQSVTPGKLLEITLIATVTLPHANSPRRQAFSYSWKTDETCVPLDMTSLTKKISNYLKKRGLAESNVTVQIEVVQTKQYDLTLTNSHDGLGKNYLQICQDLQARKSNISFLVVKYYDEGSATNGTLSSSRHNRREAPSVQSNSKVGNCSIVSMVVNLTEAYGRFVIAPITEDIRDCQGNCQITDLDRYSSHALVKERLRWITGKDENKWSVSCVPTAFEPLELLIHQESHFLIVEFPDMIAKRCGCR